MTISKHNLTTMLERCEKEVRDYMDKMYFDNPKDFDKSRTWDGLLALSYDLPRVIAELKRLK